MSPPSPVRAASGSSVRFEAISKRYGSVSAVDDVSFEIGRGELVTLLGPSGCGKTTTLRLIAGLEMATSGRIMIGDDDVTRLSAADRDVSMVFQSYALFPHMSVLENVAYGPSVKRVPKARAREMAREKIALVGLTGLEERSPSELSGGQQQRVAVARALVLEPQVLLFDEPLSNLDAKLRRRVRDEIRELQLGLGLTVAYVTHDQEEALAVSDRIIVMSNARIAQIGTPRDLYQSPADLFVADFIGDANILDVDLVDQDERSVRVRLGKNVIAASASRLLGQKAKLVVRPDNLALADRSAAGELQGTIAKATYVGRAMEYSVDTEVGRLFILDRGEGRPFAVGEEVDVALRGGLPVALPG